MAAQKAAKKEHCGALIEQRGSARGRRARLALNEAAKMAKAIFSILQDAKCDGTFLPESPVGFRVKKRRTFPSAPMRR